MSTKVTSIKLCRSVVVWKIPWRRKWQPTPVFLPRKFHGQKSLEDYSPQSRKELDITEVTSYTHALFS